jgi:hypothetical protein
VTRSRTTFALVTLALVGAGAAAAQQAAPARTPPPRMLHAAAGKTECLTCHGPGANEHIKSAPAAHKFGNQACPMCHRPSEHVPPTAAHAFTEATASCRTCHVANSPAGAKAPPASHENFHISICPICHQPAQGG